MKMGSGATRMSVLPLLRNVALKPNEKLQEFGAADVSEVRPHIANHHQGQLCQLPRAARGEPA